ncbi:PepSY domain-containing protein [Bacillus wiedmannii]|uniref:PepSY domain-containing protein n=1 Tax=Bacillus wiedmannii TaxID=1890302 RepID=UPI003D96EF16
MLKHKKKIIISVISILLIGTAIVGGYYGMGYNYAKKNENYTEKQVREIALAHTNGEIINVKKEFELEDDNFTQSKFEYEVEIKAPENLLNTLKVSARTGTIEIDTED